MVSASVPRHASYKYQPSLAKTTSVLLKHSSALPPPLMRPLEPLALELFRRRADLGHPQLSHTHFIHTICRRWPQSVAFRVLTSTRGSLHAEVRSILTCFLLAHP